MNLRWQRPVGRLRVVRPDDGMRPVLEERLQHDRRARRYPGPAPDQRLERGRRAIDKTASAGDPAVGECRLNERGLDLSQVGARQRDVKYVNRGRPGCWGSWVALWPLQAIWTASSRRLIIYPDHRTVPDRQARLTYLVPGVTVPEPQAARAPGAPVRTTNRSWRWRESNPRPPSPQQGFSGRSVPCRYSAPPVLHTSRCDGPSRCELSRPGPRPARTVSHLADASEPSR